MQYLLMMTSDEAVWDGFSPDQQQHIIQRHGALADELKAKNKFVGSNRLGAGADAKTLRSNGKEVVVTDGPFTETKEVMGGYYVIDADSIEEAVAWAKWVPPECFISIEVRPLWENS